MKAGDPILIEVDGKWRRGSFLADHGGAVYMVGIGEPHYFNYEKRKVANTQVKRFIPLTDEDAAATHQAELPQAFAMVEAALKALLPDEKVEIKDGSILAYHGGVTLDPVVYETSRIGAVQETAGWQVHVVHYHYATMDQPEEYELVEVGAASRLAAAVLLFIETIFKQKAHCYWERLGEEEMAQSWDDGEM
jgi:hypothetical protein